jgi:hypothetical protein
MGLIDPVLPVVRGSFRVHNCDPLAYVLRNTMMRIRPAWSLYLISWIGIPVLFATFVGVEYHLSLRAGNLPFVGDREWKWWVAFAVSLLCGVACIARAHLYQRVAQVLMPLLYLTVMAIALLLFHVAVACTNGDCL